MIHMYGIPNCDSIRKARTWLKQQGAAYTFHDYRKDGVEISMLEAVVDVYGWEAVLNRRGTTWRKLSDSDKQDVDGKKAISLMLAQPSMIKRPIVIRGQHILVGFSEDQYRELLA